MRSYLREVLADKVYRGKKQLHHFGEFGKKGTVIQTISCCSCLDGK